MRDPVEAVIHFWFEELSPKDWYGAPPHVDAAVTAGFGATYEVLKDRVPQTWPRTPRGMLAAILVLDQFPRNMFRGTRLAFATDSLALELAKEAISTAADMDLPPEQRCFVYMPYQHAENRIDQVRSVELFTALGDPVNLDYAERHRAVIERFGRFPHRNAILGRVSTTEEIAFLKQKGSAF